MYVALYVGLDLGAPYLFCGEITVEEGMGPPGFSTKLVQINTQFVL